MNDQAGALSMKDGQFPLVLRISIAVILFGMARGIYVHLAKEPVAQILRTPAPRIDARYAEIRNALPAHGRVGYVSDLPLDHEEGDALHLQAMYALAPLIVARDDGTPGLVIANLARPSELPVICRRTGLVTVKDFGSGLVLMRRPEMP